MKVFSPKKLDDLLNNPCIRASGIATVAGISPKGLWQIRHGKRRPQFDTLAAIAQALNKPLDYFLEEEAVVNQQQMLLDTRSVANG